MNQDLTTLICLFHENDHARTALEKILSTGVPEANVVLIGSTGSNIKAAPSTLTELNVPEKDVQHLLDGIHAGGAVLSVQALSDHVSDVESIFRDYAMKIDEVTVADDMSGSALPPAFQASSKTMADEMPVREKAFTDSNTRVYRRVMGSTSEESRTNFDEPVRRD